MLNIINQQTTNSIPFERECPFCGNPINTYTYANTLRVKNTKYTYKHKQLYSENNNVNIKIESIIDILCLECHRLVDVHMHIFAKTTTPMTKDPLWKILYEPDERIVFTIRASRQPFLFDVFQKYTTQNMSEFHLITKRHILISTYEIDYIGIHEKFLEKQTACLYAYVKSLCKDNPQLNNHSLFKDSSFEQFKFEQIHLDLSKLK